MIDFTTSTAPWVFVAASALLGTLLGGFLSWLGARLNDRARAKREAKARWDGDIRTYAASLLQKSHEQTRAVRTIRHLYRNPALLASGGGHLELQRQAIATITPTLYADVNGLYLIAPKAISQAAHRVANATMDAAMNLNDSGQSLLEVNHAKEHFVDKIHQYLDIEKSKGNLQLFPKEEEQ
ncbi:hypothetical protein [Rathayibacter sp. AY1C4]|uniref:hypothetical protein n=1 Tax=Rathayibacter sp. AY1C4 TaxID=2080537 RepID=UPI0011B068B2|nr:hypothetical protein [Rathayibacter sp. AY1C4]